MKRKGISKMFVIVPLVIIVLIGAILAGGLIYTEGERREAKNLPITDIDFGGLKDGTYVGEYEGGMYKWRATKAQVTVSSGRVTDIRSLGMAQGGCNQDPKFIGELYENVIEAQSLQVDTISGATLTTKAYLKSVENALQNAQE